MARWLKQSTSVDLPIGPFLDATDGATAMTGLTLTQPDIRLKKNGGAWAQKAAAQTLSHEENGYYEVTLDATDTNTLGCLRLAVNEATALPVWEEFMVISADWWDSVFGANNLPVNIVQDSVALAAASDLAAMQTDVDAILLDTAEIGAAGAGLTAITAKTALIPGTQDGKTFAQHVILQSSVLMGKSSGFLTSAPAYRALDDSKDRVTATTTADGRMSVTLDAT